MVLYFIGLGLNSEKDVSIKGLELVKSADVVYLESYTSKLNVSVSSLERFYNMSEIGYPISEHAQKPLVFDKKIIQADREMVEKEAEKTILKDAKEKKVAFLVVGDPMVATTHVDLLLRAKKSGIEVRVVHNASILTAVGLTGLQLYNFGKVASIPFDNYNIKSPIEVLKNNQKFGLHTLFLFDLDPKEKRYMTINEAVEYLIKNKIKENTKAVACASLGSDKPFIKYGLLEELKKLEIKKFPQCLIIPGKLHFMEEEALKIYG